MVSKVSLEIETRMSSGKTREINVNYINPAATNEQLKEFSQRLVALTNDNYDSATKITRESVI